MLSKKWLSLIKSLQIKKYRILHQSFTVEGAKSVQELLQSDFSVEMVFCTEDFHEKNEILLKKIPFEIVSETELTQAGTFESNNACLAVARTRPNDFLQVVDNEFILVLDDIKDPGNLGTILRIADWYGISKIICSPETVDFYNPKVISASMGSFTRVRVYYEELPVYFEKIKVKLPDTPVYGTLLEGKNIHQVHFASSGYIVMGNESKGISEKLLPFLTEALHIPRYGKAESLNVAIATAVILDNLQRNG